MTVGEDDFFLCKMVGCKCRGSIDVRSVEMRMILDNLIDCHSTGKLAQQQLNRDTRL